MSSGLVWLNPANRSIDRNVCDMDSLWPKLGSHTLCQTEFAMGSHGEGTALRETLECCTRVRKDDRALVGIIACRLHGLCRLLTYKERTVCRTSQYTEHCR